MVSNFPILMGLQSGRKTSQLSDIHLYLVEKPGIYTRVKLQAYKSLDGSNYLMCGHVQSRQHHDINREFCVLRSRVLSSQRQGHHTEMYDPWAIVNRKENCILTVKLYLHGWVSNIGSVSVLVCPVVSRHPS